jgi:hypothetical protein
MDPGCRWRNGFWIGRVLSYIPGLPSRLRVAADPVLTAPRRRGHEPGHRDTSDGGRPCRRALSRGRSAGSAVRKRRQLFAAGRVAAYGGCGLDRSCHRRKRVQQDWLHRERFRHRHRKIGSVGPRSLCLGESKQGAPQIRVTPRHDGGCSDLLQPQTRGVARARAERVDRSWPHDAQAASGQPSSQADSG